MKLFIFFALFALLGCQSLPVDSGAAVDTQAEIAAGIETVTTGASTIADQAANIADTLENLAQNNPEIATVAAIAVSHATFTAKHAKDTTELQKSVYKARMEVIALLKREALLVKDREGRIKAEGQRNTAWMALAGVAAVVGVLVFFKIKKVAQK